LATREIAAMIGLSARATRTRLARLIDRGLVREIGTSAKDPQRKYFLAEGVHQ
jgi:DNA-binding Lrp family transcriptional regulator